MKLLFDLFPLLIFFGVFKAYGILPATAAAIGATFLVVVIHWFKHRRLEPIHLITLAIISIFGGLTLLFADDTFIKWKPTVINWLFAAVILGMLFGSRKSALEFVMGSQISLPEAVWRRLNWAWAIFFIALGALNVYVAFYFNAAAPEEVRTETWVDFKVFWMFGLTMIFAVIQMLFIVKHIEAADKSDG